MALEDPESDIDERLERLREEARQVGELTDALVELPESGRVYTVARPTDTDGLLERAEADPEQNLPYWAEIWPSGVALADAIAREPGLVRGERVLEIGSGLGVTAIAALEAGAQLTAADYAPESLLLCRYNGLRNAGSEPAVLQINWRRPAQALFDLAGNGLPVVLAADVLYEERDVMPLLRLSGLIVAQGGLLWLAEPGRAVAERFLEAASELGWQGTTEEFLGPWPDPKEAAVVVRVHKLWRGR